MPNHHLHHGSGKLHLTVPLNKQKLPNDTMNLPRQPLVSNLSPRTRNTPSSAGRHTGPFVPSSSSHGKNETMSAVMMLSTTTTRMATPSSSSSSFSSRRSRSSFKTVAGVQQQREKMGGGMRVTGGGGCGGAVKRTAAVAASRRTTTTVPSAPARGLRVLTQAAQDDSGVIDAGSFESTKSKINKFVQDNSVEIAAVVNVAIVGSVAFGAFYEVLEVDSDINTGWTWYEILRNVPQDNLQAYQQAVLDHTLPVKAMTSGVAYTLGDFTCQLSQGKTIATVDLKRSLRSGIAGFMIHGPLCHYWLMWTENNLSFDGAWWATPVKVFADQTVWSLFLNTAYTTCIMSLQGMGPQKIKGEVQATWWNAISAGWKFWPFVHMLTFSSFIPQDFKLLFVDCVEVIWVTILSAAVNRDKDKALQVPLNAETERPGMQMQEQLDNEFALSVNGVEEDFADQKEFLPTRDERINASGSGSFDEGETPAEQTMTVEGVEQKAR